MPKVSGGLSIDVFTMTIKVNLIVSETMSVELKLHNIKLGTSPIEEVMDSGSLAPASAADFKDIFKSSVEIQLLGSLGYTLNASGTAAADLSEIFTLIKNKQGVSLLQNPLVQIDITNDVDMHHVANTYVYVDLNDFSKLKVAVEIYKDVADMTNGVGTAIAAYIDGTDIYVDVSALGIPKLRIANVNIAKSSKTLCRTPVCSPQPTAALNTTWVKAGAICCSATSATCKLTLPSCSRLNASQSASTCI